MTEPGPSTLILDSSFLIAYYNTNDVHHPSAARQMVSIAGGGWEHVILLEYVFLEVVTVLLLKTDLETATTVGDILLGARELEFVPCSDLFLETLQTFRDQAEGKLSFVDSAIATTAWRYDSEVASFDKQLMEAVGR